MSKFIILTAALLASVVTIASAETWRSATWGRGWATVVGVGSFGLDRVDGETKDIKEDGYCVYARYRERGSSWPGKEIEGSKSCSPTAKRFVAAGTFIDGVRLYREDGRYLTLYGN